MSAILSEITGKSTVFFNDLFSQIAIKHEISAHDFLYVEAIGERHSNPQTAWKQKDQRWVRF